MLDDVLSYNGRIGCSDQSEDALLCLIISDIHANLPALDSVLADAGTFDQIWCLGDVVGYGPDPNECVERIRGFDHISLVGNHDQGVLGRLNLTNFNAEARIANQWTRERLSDDVRDYLEKLPMHIERGDYYLVHASPREPTWEYVLDAHTAYANFSHFSTPVCLLGHSHVPLIFALEERDNARDELDMLLPGAGDVQSLKQRRMIVNPGSVGQPRDGDPRAAYALLDADSGRCEFRRVAYPVEEVQERMHQVGLPQRLIARLSLGR